MINLTNLTRQHTTIMDEVNLIEDEIRKPLINTDETALHINLLAGHLKMHLMSEDKYLYPDLLVCSDKEIQTMAKQYMDEMGNLSETYKEYKNNYNVGSKIIENQNKFKNDTIKIVNELKKRIDKEEKGLYTLIKDRKL